MGQAFQRRPLLPQAHHPGVRGGGTVLWIGLLRNGGDQPDGLDGTVIEVHVALDGRQWHILEIQFGLRTLERRLGRLQTDSRLHGGARGNLHVRKPGEDRPKLRIRLSLHSIGSRRPGQP